MNDNVRKIFDMLGVEPNERFKIERCGNPTTIYTIDENLIIIDDNFSNNFSLSIILSPQFLGLGIYRYKGLCDLSSHI